MGDEADALMARSIDRELTEPVSTRRKNMPPTTPPAAKPSTAAPSTPARAPSRPPPAAAKPVAVPAFEILTPRPIAPRLIINGVEGWGKTSLAVNAPGAAIVMAKGETGYRTLLDANRVPSVPALVADSWEGLLAMLDKLAEEPGKIQTLVLDALGGFERLCHEFVCARDFGNVWSEKGFTGFGRGYDVSVTEWLGLLNRLDRLNTKGMAIYLLSHVQVKSFKNPQGADFDRYESACHAKTWGATHKWADAVLFATYRTITDEKKGKTKGIGGTDRVVYAERRDAFDAKNRYGFPEELDIPADPASAYQTIAAYFTPSSNPSA